MSDTADVGRFAVGYVRVSSADQAAHGISLELQRHRIRLFAESKGLSLHPIIFGDEGVSGRRSANRPALAEAVAMAVTSQAVLIVYSLSRFARSTRDCIDLSDQLSKAGADLISLNESIDTTSAHGRFFFTLLAALAQLESDQMSDRLKAVFAHKRQKHEVCGGFLPWGQRVSPDGKHVEPDAAELDALDKIIAARTSGLSWADVQRRVTEEGVRNRNGGPFSESNLVRIYKRHGPARGAPTEVYVAGLRERRAAGLALGRESRRQKLAGLLPPPASKPSGKGPAFDRQRAKVIGQVDDYRGDRHDVHEARATTHGFYLMLGWPVSRTGRSKGAAAVIATRPMVELLLAHARTGRNPSLPLNHQAINRVQRVLGISCRTFTREWWAEQAEVIGKTTLRAFGASHGLSKSAVSNQMRRMGQRRANPPGWWRGQRPKRVLLERSPADAARVLGVSVSTARRLRWMLRREDRSAATP